MHPKNPFAEDYDFDLLIEHKPELKDFVFVNEHGTKTIKFGNQEAVRALNSALLKSQYDLDWSLPKGYLCPPVPGRLDYLLYASDLLEKEDIRLLDIGTGANLIYPMLGKRHFNWKCTGSEVESLSLDHAQKIVDRNELLDDTDLRLQTNKNRIFENVIEAKDQFDLVVCNPPFFQERADGSKRESTQIQKPQALGIREVEFWGKGERVVVSRWRSRFHRAYGFGESTIQRTNSLVHLFGFKKGKSENHQAFYKKSRSQRNSRG